MITRAEIAAGFAGAWRLARRDPTGLSCFDASPRGYWQSYWALVLLAPGDFLVDALTGGLGQSLGLRATLIHLISLVVDATAFPLAMLFLADRLGLWPRYPRYIVAYNWSALVQFLVILPFTLAALNEPSHGVILLLQVVTVLILVYRAYIAHVALGVGLATAAGIVLVDVLLATIIRQTTLHLSAGI